MMKLLFIFIFSFALNAELTVTDANFGSIGSLAIYSECPTLIAIRVQESSHNSDQDESFKFKFNLLEIVAGKLHKSINTASTFSSGDRSLGDFRTARKIPIGAQVIIGGKLSESQLSVVDQCIFKDTGEVRKYLKCIYASGAWLEKHVENKVKGSFKPKKCLQPQLLRYE